MYVSPPSATDHHVTTTTNVATLTGNRSTPCSTSSHAWMSPSGVNMRRHQPEPGGAWRYCTRNRGWRSTGSMRTRSTSASPRAANSVATSTGMPSRVISRPPPTDRPVITRTNAMMPSGKPIRTYAVSMPSWASKPRAGGRSATAVWVGAWCGVGVEAVMVVMSLTLGRYGA